MPGVLGEKHASGTEIIKELGEEHLKTGKPIIYTSADSVLQIAAHEEVFGLERLYELCKICYELVKPYHIARVIARPFVGTRAEDFVRTGNRHDYAVPAPADTLLDKLVAAGGSVYAVGKMLIFFLTAELRSIILPVVLINYLPLHCRLCKKLLIIAWFL